MEKDYFACPRKKSSRATLILYAKPAGLSTLALLVRMHGLAERIPPRRKRAYSGQSEAAVLLKIWS
jgi:hypothetical protein